MAQEDIGIGGSSSSSSSPIINNIINWLNGHGFSPDSNINKNGDVITKDGVPYTPTSGELNTLNTPQTLFPGINLPSSNLLGIGAIIVVVLLLFKK